MSESPEALKASPARAHPLDELVGLLDECADAEAWPCWGASAEAAASAELDRLVGLLEELLELWLADRATSWTLMRLARVRMMLHPLIRAAQAAGDRRFGRLVAMHQTVDARIGEVRERPAVHRPLERVRIPVPVVPAHGLRRVLRPARPRECRVVRRRRAVSRASPDDHPGGDGEPHDDVVVARRGRGRRPG
jgi:hypothetical protein